MKTKHEIITTNCWFVHPPSWGGHNKQMQQVGLSRKKFSKQLERLKTKT